MLIWSRYQCDNQTKVKSLATSRILLRSAYCPVTGGPSITPDQKRGDCPRFQRISSLGKLWRSSHCSPKVTQKGGNTQWETKPGLTKKSKSRAERKGISLPLTGLELRNARTDDKGGGSTISIDGKIGLIRKRVYGVGKIGRAIKSHSVPIEAKCRKERRGWGREITVLGVQQGEKRR